MSLPRDEHRCVQCGTCCRGPIPVTMDDLLRWAAQGRHDILFRILPSEMIIEPLARNERQTCRYLAPLPGRGICACSIYNTRPAVCAGFPSSVNRAARAGCQGLAPAPHVRDTAPS